MVKNHYDNPQVQAFASNVVSPTYEATHINYRDRLLINGATGTGKTNLVFDFLMKSPFTFEHIIVVSRGVEEPLYQFMKEKLEDAGALSFFTIATLPDVLEIERLRMNRNDEYLIIFDDLVAELSDRKNRQKVANYMLTGRKCGLTQIFITQSYYDTPKIIRLQMNKLFLLRLGSSNDLALVLREQRLEGMTSKKLAALHRIATENKMDPLLIKTDESDGNKKYARNFKEYFSMKSFVNDKGETEVDMSPGDWYKPVLAKRKRDDDDA